jgi:hypothetical protein
VNPQMRVADADRDRACDILREHFAVGRLDQDELINRIAAAQAAVRWGDLQQLLSDLPLIPGMHLHYPGHLPVPAPPVPVPPRPVYGSPVAMRSADPASGWRTAGWVCFALGFFTCGITWLFAVAFAIVAANVDRPTGWGPRGEGPVPAGMMRPPARRRYGGLIAAGVVVTVLLAVGWLSSPMSSPMSASVSHEVTFTVTSYDPSAMAGVVIWTADDTMTAEGRSLPHQEIFVVEGPAIQVEASADDGHTTKRPRKPVQLSCTLTVDGERVEQTYGLGSCTVSYKS